MCTIRYTTDSHAQKREEFEYIPIDPTFGAVNQGYLNFYFSRFVSRKEGAVDPAYVPPHPAEIPDKEELRHY